MQHRAKKRFGQNFLVDRHVIDRIISSIDPGADDCLVEIGPGLGALSKPLLEHVSRLHVIELDRDVIPDLLKACGNTDRLKVHHGDVLKFDFGEFSSLHCTDGGLRIIGNLPYNISTAVLFHLLHYRSSIRDMHFMLQKEVVNRIAASPHDSNYGRLSVMMQTWHQVEPLFTVSPGCFRPVPKVESAIIRLRPKAVRIDRPGDYERLVKQAFSQRRKTLRNTLKQICKSEQLEQAGIDPGQRPQELAVEDFLRLYRLLAGNNHSSHDV